MAAEGAREPFWCPVKVRFGDVDPAGVVYYPTFMHYFHIALEEFIAHSLNVRYSTLIQKERIGFPTVRVVCNFSGPVRYGDDLTIRVWISRIGGASVTFEFEARKEEEVCARATLTKVVLDLNRWKPMIVPKQIKASFQEYLETA